MKRALLVSGASLLGLLMLGGPLAAHHGVQGYDHSNRLTLTGTIAEVVWANPHAQIYFDAKDKTGAMVHWGLELNSPGNLVRIGWERSSLKAGETVQASFFPDEKGKHAGICIDIVKADGKKLHSNQGCGNNPAGNQ